jgi:hypothetical protein
MGCEISPLFPNADFVSFGASKYFPETKGNQLRLNDFILDFIRPNPSSLQIVNISYLPSEYYYNLFFAGFHTTLSFKSTGCAKNFIKS